MKKAVVIRHRRYGSNNPTTNNSDDFQTVTSMGRRPVLEGKSHKNF